MFTIVAIFLHSCNNYVTYPELSSSSCLNNLADSDSVRGIYIKMTSNVPRASDVGIL